MSFFRNLFGSGKGQKPIKEDTSQTKAADGDEDSPITPGRRLSLSKSGKMKRKSYSRQVSVTDTKFFENPERNGNQKIAEDAKEDVSIDDVVKDILATVESTKM